MEVFLWLFLFMLVVGAAVLLATWLRARRRDAELWGGQEPDQIAKWNEQTLGISEVRVHTERKEPESPRFQTAAVPSAASPEAPAQPTAPSPRAEAAAPQASDRRASGESAASPAPDSALSVPTTPSSREPARPARSRPEWWEQDASGAGALLRSLVDVTGGSAAIVRPSPDGYAVIAASGAASAAIHAHADARTLDARSARPLADLPAGLATFVLGGNEAGLLPGMDADAVGETAVRSLRTAPGSPCLVLDVLDDQPLTPRAEGLISAYADLAARVLDLPEDAPTQEASSGSSLEGAMERVEKEINAAREQGRDLSLALVVPHDAEDILEGEPEEIDAHAAALRQRLLAVPGTREVLAMGDLVLGALCEMKGPGAERWARNLTRDGDPVRIGIAVYGPRHVTPNLLRQDAVTALHQTYTTEESCVIVD